MNLINVKLTYDERYEFIKLYDILRDMDFELSEKQQSVFEKIEQVDNSSDFLDSLSEGKEYGSKVDALVDSMGVTDKEVSTIHRRRDLDTL